MEVIVLLLLFFLFNNIYSTEAIDVKKLFVFGDSLVDVGNHATGEGWREPYGMTFPGKPAGRFSDGRVLSDNIASFLGLEAPVAFNKKESAEKSKLQNGMNFACGGSGVFDTLNLNRNAPKMAKQVDNLQQLLEKEKLYTKDDLKSSLAFVNIGVNDYMEYYITRQKTQSWSELSASLIDQFVIDIKRIQDLGVPKIVVATVMPIGCAPSFNTKLDHKTCDEAINKDVDLHNQKLKEAVKKLNKVEIIDVHGAIMSVLNRPEASLRFNPLKQCCGGVVPGQDSCGTIKDGKKMYEVCENPKLSVFWDFVHPSQNGWELIYSALKSSLNVLFT